MEDEKKCKIFIASHIKIEIPNDEVYTLIEVGSINRKVNFSECNDGLGDNISELNLLFCELTALYWIWKNEKNIQIVGLVHYRRFFETIDDSITYNGRNLISGKEIRSIIKNDWDLILPKKEKVKILRCVPVNTKQQYKHSHHIKDWIETRNIIEELHPDYLISFDEISKSKELYFYNMFVAGRKFTDGYCEWLFTILFKLKENLDITSYDDYDKRVYGFLSERLLNVYIKHHHEKIKITELKTTFRKKTLTRKLDVNWIMGKIKKWSSNKGL